MARQPKETISLALLLTDGGPALAAAIDAVGGLIIVADDGEVTILVDSQYDEIACAAIIAFETAQNS